ncbi:beta-propeller fold lactonase family protein [Rothia sp. ARF10]|nr:beta-propeller fold lactonase family protein [Rothia sp. ARF10]
MPWVAVASAPADGLLGRVSLHPWDGGHRLGAEVAGVELPNPSWLTWSPDGRRLHVACEVEEGHVVTLAVEGGGPGVTLRLLSQASTGGSHPCHLALEGSTLFAANYADGTASVMDVVDGAATEFLEVVRLTGRGPHPTRQDGSFAHQVTPLGGDRVAVVNLGADEIVTYAVRGHRLVARQTCGLPAGTGPRHLTRHAATGRAWVGGELAGTVVALKEDEGAFTVVGQCPASGSDVENLVAHIWVDAAGERLILSNRGPDTLSVFDVTAEVPVLLAETASPAHPRQFHVEGQVVLVAGRDADAVTTHDLERDAVSEARSELPVSAPMCVAPQPATG